MHCQGASTQERTTPFHPQYAARSLLLSVLVHKVHTMSLEVQPRHSLHCAGQEGCSMPLNTVTQRIFWMMYLLHHLLLLPPRHGSLQLLWVAGCPMQAPHLRRCDTLRLMELDSYLACVARARSMCCQLGRHLCRLFSPGLQLSMSR